MIYTCWSCRKENDIDELDGEDHFDCVECEERNYIIGTRTMNYDDYYESCCESREASRTEEAAYGHDTDDDHFVESDTPMAFTDSRWD